MMSGEKMTQQQLSDILIDFCSHTFLVGLCILCESTSNRVNQNVERTHNLSFSLSLSDFYLVTGNFHNQVSWHCHWWSTKMYILHFFLYLCDENLATSLPLSLTLASRPWLTDFAVWLEDMQGTTRDATRKEKKTTTSDHNARHVSKWVKWEKHLYLSTTVCFWRPLPFCAHSEAERQSHCFYILPRQNTDN